MQFKVKTAALSFEVENWFQRYEGEKVTDVEKYIPYSFNKMQICPSHFYSKSNNLP